MEPWQTASLGEGAIVAHGELRALGRLLETSHDLPADALVGAVADAAAELGAHEVEIYLVDYEQALLLPLPDGIQRPSLEVDTTLPGRVFTTGEALEADATGGRRLWLPLIDGADRLGVIGLTLAGPTEADRDGCRHLSTLVAELLVSKSQYTDAYFLARRRRPMSLVAEMQWRLLPPLTYMTPTVVISAVLEPAYEVAGDAFDYAVNGDIAHIAIIDPVGHDLAASVLAAVALGSYRHSRRAALGLTETHAAMGEVIAGQFGGERFVTGQLGELDCQSGRLRWLNAGHPPPLLVRGAKVVGALTCPPTPPFGVGEVVEAEIGTAALEPGDRVLFYTDGCVEGRNAAGEPFGEDRLADLLTRQTLAGRGAAETVRRLSQAVLAHQGNKPRDDATMVFVEWRASAR
jgi:serine phosphatase RsbU (regulator of sigma subunit)